MRPILVQAGVRVRHRRHAGVFTIVRRSFVPGHVVICDEHGAEKTVPISDLINEPSAGKDPPGE